MPEIPRLLEPQQLLDLLPRPDILVIDLSNEETYLSGHIPGAVHLNPGLLMSGKKPAAGRLPALENLTRLLNKLGIDKDRHVVACDEEGGSRSDPELGPGWDETGNCVQSQDGFSPGGDPLRLRVLPPGA